MSHGTRVPRDPEAHPQVAPAAPADAVPQQAPLVIQLPDDDVPSAVRQVPVARRPPVAPVARPVRDSHEHNPLWSIGGPVAVVGLAVLTFVTSGDPMMIVLVAAVAAVVFLVLEFQR